MEKGTMKMAAPPQLPPLPVSSWPLRVVIRSKRRRTGGNLVIRCILIALLLLFTCDALRAPAHQVSARMYIWIVHQYQIYASPALSHRIHCRFVPSCSEYSWRAVKKFGIVRGGLLTVERLARCNPWQKPNTPDPIP
jgi:putative membrane protein insertion efficiency factor